MEDASAYATKGLTPIRVVIVSPRTQDLNEHDKVAKPRFELNERDESFTSFLSVQLPTMK